MVSKLHTNLSQNIIPGGLNIDVHTVIIFEDMVVYTRGMSWLTSTRGLFLAWLGIAAITSCVRCCAVLRALVSRWRVLWLELLLCILCIVVKALVSHYVV